MLDLNQNPKDIQEGTLNALIMIHNECEGAGALEAMYQLADLIDQVACRHLVVTMPAGPRVPPDAASKPAGRARMLLLTEDQVNALGRALDFAADDQEHAPKDDYSPEDLADLAATYRDIGSVGAMLFPGELERWGALANEVLGEDTCRICATQYAAGADGYDDCCPGCADKVNELAEAKGISFDEAADIYVVDNTAECGKCVDCGAQCVSGGDGSVVCPKCDGKEEVV